MSIRIWEEIATQKKQVEDQREKILNAFKKRSVEDQVGMLKAEKLFKPITKLLGKPRQDEKPVPDYDLDDQTRNFKNELPFGEGDYEEVKPDEDPYSDLKPFEKEEMMVPESESQAGSDFEYEWDGIIPLPDKSSPDPDEISPLPDPDPDELGEEVLPGEKQLPQSAPSYSEATKDDKPPKYKEPRGDDSSDLSTLKKFLKNNEGKPGAKITTKKSKFFGTDVEQARYAVYEIYTERAKKVLAAGDRRPVIGQKGLGPYEGKSNREMRAMIDKFEKGKIKFGSGFNGLINRLSLGISSIIAGNTSIKLRKEISSIAKLLHQKGVISKEQKNKVLSLK